MLRRTLAASLTLAVAVPGVASAEMPVAHVSCRKTFTVRMTEHAFRVVYRGRRRVVEKERLMLGRIIRCERNAGNKPRMIAFGRRERAAWKQRRDYVATPYDAWASWYYDAGETASGYHSWYGVANRYLPFGTRVLIRYGGRAITAVVDDRGPYVYPREWDLNQNTAAALGFSGVGVVQTSVPG